jgi:hypothetical protein
MFELFYGSENYLGGCSSLSTSLFFQADNDKTMPAYQQGQVGGQSHE